MSLLEVVAFNSKSAIDASLCGVDRIEICENYYEGGTTPSYGTVKYLIDKLYIPTFPMVRPRGGDFLYSSEEIEVMCEDILRFKDLGCKGIVLGLLNKEGSVNYNVLCRMVDLAYPMEVTFHRAIDRVINFPEAIEDVYKAGCKRILTSGGKPTAKEGLGNLANLMNLCVGKLKIVAGGGVDLIAVQSLIDLGIEEIHTPARIMIDSQMDYINQNMNESLVYSGIDTEALKKMVQYAHSNN